MEDSDEDSGEQEAATEIEAETFAADSARERPPLQPYVERQEGGDLVLQVPGASGSSTAIQLGRAPAHESHRLLFRRGIIICSRCGCYGITVLSNLTRSCKVARKNTQGWKNLNRWHRGLPPSNVAFWPLAVNDSPYEGVI